MDKLILFITILAWVLGSLSTVWGLAQLYFLLTYTELQRTIDQVTEGGVYVYNPVRPLLLAIVCWTWVITFW